jgi:hypothetical protein
MRGEMSKALGPERFVPEGLHEGSLARSAWKRAIRAIRRERCDRVGASGYSMPGKRSRTIDKIDQTVPTGRVFFSLVPGTSCQATFIKSLRDGNLVQRFAPFLRTTPILHFPNIPPLPRGRERERGRIVNATNPEPSL